MDGILEQQQAIAARDARHLSDIDEMLTAINKQIASELARRDQVVAEIIDRGRGGDYQIISLQVERQRAMCTLRTFDMMIEREQLIKHRRVLQGLSP